MSVDVKELIPSIVGATVGGLAGIAAMILLIVVDPQIPVSWMIVFVFVVAGVVGLAAGLTIRRHLGRTKKW